jgi:hypothetical protein
MPVVSEEPQPPGKRLGRTSTWLAAIVFVLIACFGTIVLRIGAKRETGNQLVQPQPPPQNPPVRGPEPLGPRQAQLAPGVTVRLEDPKHPRDPSFDSTARTPPSAVVVVGKKARLTFGRFFTDPAVFTREELKDIRYQMGRNYLDPNTYNFFGLAERDGRVYVGVNWYSSMGSGEPSAYGVIFQLRWQRGRLTARPYKHLSDHGNKYMRYVPDSVLLHSLGVSTEQGVKRP